MDYNWLLIWMILASCGLNVFQVLKSELSVPTRLRTFFSRLSIPLLILGVLAVSYVFVHPTHAGFYAGAVWLLLVLVPGMLFRWINSLLGARRYSQALIVSRFASVLHPFDGARDQTQLIRALRYFYLGQRREGLELLSELERKPTSTGRTAAILKVRHSGDWESFLQTMESPQMRNLILREPLGVDLYLQSLGESGQTEEMVKVFDRHVLRRRGAASATLINLIRLKVAAFCGQPELAKLISDGPLSHLSPDTARMWEATALQANGQIVQAEEILSELSNSADLYIQSTARKRIAAPISTVQQLSENGRQTLMTIAQNVEHESQFAFLGQLKQRTTWTTNLLILSLVLVYVVEIVNGGVIQELFFEPNDLTVLQKLDYNMDIQNLIKCGALVLPWSKYPGEWWRVITAAFLHGGNLHLLVNCLGILMLGRRLERIWGSVTTMICYLICAVGSIAMMPLLVEKVILVGASGGLMGLIGCLLGYTWRGMLIRRNSFVSGDFKLLVAMVVFQLVFDQMTPMISSECHLAGLVIGLCLGVIVGILQQWRRNRQSDQP